MNVAAKGHVDLPVTGMTCASCAARIQRRLNRLEGVSATVNYATETATVDFDPTQATVEDLVASVVAAGYGATLPAAQGVDDLAAGDDGRVAVLRRRLVVSAVLSVPVVALAMIPALQFDRWAWVAGVLAAPVVFWGGWGFHRAAWINLRHRTATMDTLISLGSLAAFGWSVVALLFLHAGEPGGTMSMNMDMRGMAGMSGMAHRGAVYFEVAATVITLILLGRYFEARAKRRAGAALAALLALGAKDVAVIDDDGERRIPINELRVGMRFVVRPGEKVATDGTVVEGRSAIDASLLTGESLPVEVGPGDPVTGSTVNVGGRLVVVATRVGADTALARIGRLVVAAQTGKAPVQRLADRVSLVFVPAVILIAVGSLLTWLAVGASAGRAFTAAVAVLIVACPCALGLATPTAILVGSGRGAQLGLLIKGPEVLESTRRVDTIVLDKTGTLTTGRMTLVSVATIPGIDAAEAVRLVGAVEDASEHPIGRAIAAAARAAGSLPPVDSFVSHRGVGAEGLVAGHFVLAGRPSMLSERGMAIPAELLDAVTAARSDGRIAICAGWDGQATAVFVVADTVKATSAEAVAEFRALGLRPILLTGDNETTARAVAAQVGITEVVADVLPEGKADVVKGLQAEGRVVAMVGDGVNDAPALAQADLGLAMGTGTDAAFEASDLTVMSPDLRLAADAIRLSRRTLRIIQSNLFWAFAYNVVALPIAAAGWLNPMIAGAAMASSSVFVVSNSLRLRRFQPRQQAALTAPAAAAAAPLPVAS
ncbi:MAG TPA: heavy metal translocating P-type ATPase [Acidimicrobiales bacterium]|nr:heavy metal translocating P-type ATPase [Acidimicrobiales bacterium]